MKKILITAKKSYLGNNLQEYLKTYYPLDFDINFITLRDSAWKCSKFKNYDVVFHVAGIAHSDTKLISKEQGHKYYEVNTDLAYEVALKAKNDGIKQFVFMSSMIIYGDSAGIGKNKIITKDTIPHPTNAYGDSKYQAEKKILELEDENFKVVILRPPMIYGKKAKGNYPILSKFAKKSPIFPKIKNNRSMLYVGNFVEFVRLIIKNEERGIFYPQNSEYTNTSELVKMISKVNGGDIILIPGFTWLLKIFAKLSATINKAFGNLTYDMSMSEYKENYRLYSLDESIYETEKK